MWRCPECGSEFTQAHQWHSCLKKSLVAHFNSRPEEFLLIFHRIISTLEPLGQFVVRSVPSAIIFKRKVSFAAIKLQKKAIAFEWLTDRLIDDDPRIVKILHVSKRKWSHVVKLKEPWEFDTTVKSYLREAYQKCAS